MKKLALVVSASALSAAMWGCIDASTEATPSTGNQATASNPFNATVATYDDLQVCVEKRNGMEVLVSSEKKTYRCVDGEWVSLNQLGDAPAGDKSPSVEDSQDLVVNSVVSSSSVSYNQGSYTHIDCGDLWCGALDMEGRVITGSEDETSGYWYDYNDNDAPMNGDSRMIFPADVEANAYGNFFGPLVEAYGGLKGSVVLGSAYEYPFAGLGFNLVSENQEGMDVTDWNGLCLTYESTMPFAVELGVEDEATVTEYNNFKITVPKSPSGQTVYLPWTKFKQEHGWGCGVDISVVLPKVAAIKFVFSQSGGDFLIRSLGKGRNCSGASVSPTVKSSSSTAKLSSSSTSVKSSSSSVKPSDSKYVSKKMYWDGSDVEGKVETGSEEETAGYWYTYDDGEMNGDSHITFPSDVEENTYGNFFGPLAEAYGGIKATLNIGTAYEYAYAGLGFNLVSENLEGMDITDWEGICLDYSSTASFSVELASEDEGTTTEMNNYKAIVPKVSGVRTTDLAWSKFKQEAGWGRFVNQAEALKKISAVRIKFTSSGDFFLRSIANYGYCGGVH